MGSMASSRQGATGGNQCIVRPDRRSPDQIQLIGITVNPPSLIDDALRIWQAGVDAVRPGPLVARKLEVTPTGFGIEDLQIDLSSTRRLVVVGAGKASAAMAMAFNRHVLAPIRRNLPGLDVTGWINCPEGTFAPEDQSEAIRLFAARPAGQNEPTEKAVEGTQQILRLVNDCHEDDVVVCLLSGGGSALLTSPAQGVDLRDKQHVARLIASAGGNIEQLNTVRRALSNVKGGGLARACRAARMLTLIISDVLGDSLETIASGPTVMTPVDPQAALEVLRDLDLLNDPRLGRVVSKLNKPAAATPTNTRLLNQAVILGNNADAVDAAGVQAVELGYRYVMEAANAPEADVREIAQYAARASMQLLRQDGVDCWISGGEPTVQLPASGRVGKGGRNQQLALAVLQELNEQGWPTAAFTRKDLAFVSGGTDGEDGPTDAAGAWFDQSLQHRADRLRLDKQRYLAEANAYAFFEDAGGLLKTGPTGTNVCDLRVALAAAR